MNNLLSQLAPIPTDISHKSLLHETRVEYREFVHFMLCEILQPDDSQITPWELEIATWTDSVLVHWADKLYRAHPASYELT